MTTGTGYAVCLARCRLVRFARLQREWGARLSPRALCLLHHVTLDEYRVLRDAGLQPEANLLIAEGRMLKLPVNVESWETDPSTPWIGDPRD